MCYNVHMYYTQHLQNFCQHINIFIYMYICTYIHMYMYHVKYGMLYLGGIVTHSSCNELTVTTEDTPVDPKAHALAAGQGGIARVGGGERDLGVECGSAQETKCV